MRGERAHRLLAGRATFVGEGTVPGILLDLGRYPGLVAGRGRVQGEVWRLDAPEVLRTLDDYEGYNFERRTTTATLASGRRVRAWLYRYRGPRTREPIPQGNWRRHRWR
ncbi:MAG: gamma-glutamylcyclotransferase [Candidatus Rokubacteria bacterium]|nr:gamma-glutamylcyclotransferase [Candidatus Rokubacteria bacterium]